MHNTCTLVEKKSLYPNVGIDNFYNVEIPTDLHTTRVCSQKSFSRVLQRSKSTVKTQLDIFESSMKFFVLLGQYFGLFPMFQINQMKKYLLFFWRYIYILVVCASQLSAAILSLNGILKTTVNLGKFERVILYCNSCLCSILTIRLASKWHWLMKQVSDANLNEYTDLSVKFKCNLATIILIGVALLNNILYKISKLATVLNCEYNNSTVYEQYIIKSYDWFFGMGVSYSLPLGISLQMLSIVASLNVTYCQVFVICVSLYLNSILQQLQKKIISFDCKYVAPSCWRELRQDYNRTTRLVHSFDGVINSIVLVTFACNLLSVCLQLYFVLRNDITIRHGTSLCPHNHNKGLLRGYDHVLANIYFVYSTIFVIIRTTVVSLIAAKVHSTSLEIVPILYSVPSPTYCIEIQRFIDQIHGNTVALTGLHFFYVTKEVILYMIGTIVTYELVLLQLQSGISCI